MRLFGGETICFSNQYVAIPFAGTRGTKVNTLPLTKEEFNKIINAPVFQDTRIISN